MFWRVYGNGKLDGFSRIEDYMGERLGLVSVDNLSNGRTAPGGGAFFFWGLVFQEKKEGLRRYISSAASNKASE